MKRFQSTFTRFSPHSVSLVSVGGTRRRQIELCLSPSMSVACTSSIEVPSRWSGLRQKEGPTESADMRVCESNESWRSNDNRCSLNGVYQQPRLSSPHLIDIHCVFRSTFFSPHPAHPRARFESRSSFPPPFPLNPLFFFSLSILLIARFEAPAAKLTGSFASRLDTVIRGGEEVSIDLYSLFTAQCLFGFGG